jgi:hypothetical protein
MEFVFVFMELFIEHVFLLSSTSVTLVTVWVIEEIASSERRNAGICN